MQTYSRFLSPPISKLTQARLSTQATFFHAILSLYYISKGVWVYLPISFEREEKKRNETVCARRHKANRKGFQTQLLNLSATI